MFLFSLGEALRFLRKGEIRRKENFSGAEKNNSAKGIRGRAKKEEIYAAKNNNSRGSGKKEEGEREERGRGQFEIKRLEERGGPLWRPSKQRF